MKKHLASLLMSCALISTTVYASTTSNHVIATIKGEEIRENQINEFFKTNFSSDPLFKDKSFWDLEQNYRDLFANLYVRNKLVDKEAKATGFENSKAFKHKLNVVKNNLIQEGLVEEYIKRHFSEKLVDNTYEKMKQQLTGQQEVKISQINVKTEQEAKNIKAKLDKKADFAKLAKEYSMDAYTKNSGGQIPNYILKANIQDKELGEKIFSLRKGESSDPIKVQDSWILIKLDDRRNYVLPKKEEILDLLIREVNTKLAQDFFNELQTKYNFQVTK